MYLKPCSAYNLPAAESLYTPSALLYELRPSRRHTRGELILTMTFHMNTEWKKRLGQFSSVPPITLFGHSFQFNGENLLALFVSLEYRQLINLVPSLNLLIYYNMIR